MVDELAWAAYSSSLARIFPNIESQKRKRTGEDCVSQRDPYTDSDASKRQKYPNGLYETAARGNAKVNSSEEGSEGHCEDSRVIESSGKDGGGEQSSGSRHSHSHVCKVIYEYDKGTYSTSFQSYHTQNTMAAPEVTTSVLDRKRYFMYTPNDILKEKMNRYVDNVYKLFDGVCSEDNCWLHPWPPSNSKNGRPRGNVQCGFVWKESSGRKSLYVNVGIVLLIVNEKITEDQKKGYVNEAWQLSHLCGNWTCCNWRHMTVESQHTNNSRNQCFRNQDLCCHRPPCMKDRKRGLPVTPTISGQIEAAIKSTQDDAITPATCCTICGKTDLCFGSRAICHSLTSVSKSQQILEKLELCSVQSDETFMAKVYLRQIIKDLIREEGAA